MNCTQFSQQLGSQPNALSDDMHAHLSQCADCQTLHQELVGFDDVVRAAFNIDVPEGLGALSADAVALTEDPESLRWT